MKEEVLLSRAQFAKKMAGSVKKMPEDVRINLANLILDFMKISEKNSTFVLYDRDEPLTWGTYISRMSLKTFCDAVAKFTYNNNEHYKEPILSLSRCYLNTFNGCDVTVASPAEALTLQLDDKELHDNIEEKVNPTKARKRKRRKVKDQIISILSSEEDDDLLQTKVLQEEKKAQQDDEVLIPKKHRRFIKCSDSE